MTTAGDIIQAALEDIGAIGEGQTPSGENVQKAFLRLNRMIAQWRRKRWFIWHNVDVSITSTGALSYTIGPGGDINVPFRPNKLEAAFVRQLVPTTPNNIDYPLDVLNSYEDYSRIALKTLSAFPGYVFLDTGYPLGTIYAWPVPQASTYALHLIIRETLAAFATVSTDLDLPEEYESALEYQLALRLAPTYGLPVPEQVARLSQDAVNVLRMANFQIARLTIPADLVRPGLYNPYSDQVR